MKNSFQERKISNFHKHFRSQNIFCSWHEELFQERKISNSLPTSDLKPYSVLGKKEKYPTFTNTSDLKTLFWHEELFQERKIYNFHKHFRSSAFVIHKVLHTLKLRYNSK